MTFARSTTAPATTRGRVGAAAGAARVVLAAVLGVLAVVATPGAAAAAPAPALGVLGSDSRWAPQIASAGLNTVMLQAHWDRAQPAPGAPLSAPYVAELRRQHAEYRARGLAVVLDTGLQYTPGWVFQLPGARFVDQFGTPFGNTSASGENVADAVWNPQVRAAQADYVRALGAAVGRDAFAAVRVGGLLTGELRLPTDRSRHAAVGSWWAFSPAAQASSPVRGYRPGVSPRSATKDAAFLRWYLDSLAGYQDFLVTAVRGAFSGDLQLMYPSYGVRPGDEAAAAANGLRRSSIPYSELVQGVD